MIYNTGYDYVLFNATFNNISDISFFGGGNRSTPRKLATCGMPPTNFIT